MNTQTKDNASGATWFVGAAYGGTDDQLPRFLSEGIWENGYDDKLLDMVRSMRPGERIAIKSSYTRKHGLQRTCERSQTRSLTSSRRARALLPLRL
jgi:5-methylcytosine-specific restriction enzyme B